MSLKPRSVLRLNGPRMWLCEISFLSVDLAPVGGDDTGTRPVQYLAGDPALQWWNPPFGRP